MNKVSLADIKANIDIVEVISQYTELKRENSTRYKAVVNPIREENSSSFFVFTDTQRWFDFGGGGEGGDVFDFISKVENIPLSEAIARFNENAAYTASKPIKREPIKEKPTLSSEQLEKEFNSFQKLTFKNPEHKKELLAVAPFYLYKQADEVDLDFFHSITRFDSKNKTMVAGWYKNRDLEFEMVTYKRRRFGNGKWINRKDTRANKYPFYRIFKDKPTLIVEGAHDTLTAILLGLNVVGLPSATFSNMDDLRTMLKGEDVICIAEDKTSYKCMDRIRQNIKDFCKVSLKTFTANPNVKVDLSDFAYKCNSKNEVLKEIGNV